MKTCSVCGAVKAFDEFHKRARSADGLNYFCRSCANEKHRQWVLMNPDRSKEIWDRVLAKHGERIKAERKARYAREKAADPLAKRRFYAENTEREKLRVRKYRQKNPEKIRQYAREYAKKNPELVSSFTRQRRALKIGAEGRHTADEIRQLIRKQRGKCACCRKRMSPPSIDHIQPLSRGGSNDILNIQMLCRSCNSRKHAKDPIAFMQERGFLL